MKLFFKFFGIGVIIFAIFFSHLAILNILPKPYNLLDVSITGVIWAMYAWGPRRAGWVAFILAILLESFSALIFGTLLISFFAMVLFLKWLLHNVFTNRSLYIVLLLGIFGALFYRAILLAIVVIESVFWDSPYFNVWNYVLDSAWSIGFSTLVLFLWFAISAVFAKRLRPSYLKFGRNIL